MSLYILFIHRIIISNGMRSSKINYIIIVIFSSAVCMIPLSITLLNDGKDKGGNIVSIMVFGAIFFIHIVLWYPVKNPRLFKKKKD